MDKCLHLLEFSDRKYRDLPQRPLAYLHETIATAADQVTGQTHATSSWGLFNLSQRKREKWHGLPGLLVQNSASLCCTAWSFLTKPLLSQGKVGQKISRKDDSSLLFLWSEHNQSHATSQNINVTCSSPSLFSSLLGKKMMELDDLYLQLISVPNFSLSTQTRLKQVSILIRNIWQKDRHLKKVWGERERERESEEKERGREDQKEPLPGGEVKEEHMTNPSLDPRLLRI